MSMRHECVVLMFVAIGITQIDSFSTLPQSDWRVVHHRSSPTRRETPCLLASHAKSNVDIFSVVDDEKAVTKVRSPEAQILPDSETQQRSIKSSSPAVLLKSGPGTGKTFTLASRVAHLLQSETCSPERMVLMSFSNRDANALKAKSLDLTFSPSDGKSKPLKLTRKELSDRLWSGTIHKFASNVLHRYNRNRRPVRIVSSREAKTRIDRSLRQVLDARTYQDRPKGQEKLRAVQRMHSDALTDIRQSRNVLIHQISRCTELWKESGMLRPPAVCGIAVPGETGKELQEKRESCFELSMRLGISRNVALLAWTVAPALEEYHKQQGTCDPADVAPLAYHHLAANTEQLSKLREKLDHVIVDEYQDISVSQHALIRLLIRGLVDDRIHGNTLTDLRQLPPVLAPFPSVQPRREACLFDVPRLFCAGDSHQSIYGFRGAAPQLSIDGFRMDYPQGVVTDLDTSYRLSSDQWKTINSLTLNNDTSFIESFPQSPVGAIRAREILFESLNQCTSGSHAESLTDMLSEDMADHFASNIQVQGVWDTREEAKYIATRIRWRCNDRLKYFKSVVNTVPTTANSTSFVDPTDVAILVRGVNQLELVQEALEKVGIPFVTVTSDEGKRNTPPSTAGASNITSLSMKPVVLMTIHRSKGEEFDELYLPGWTEGVFPHPSAVSSNRVEEERRLAYVAISRARRGIVITHSFVRRSLHNGPDMKQKLVTVQVRPSRFLYELVPNGEHTVRDIVHNEEIVDLQGDDEEGVPSIIWDRSRGSKEMMTGNNVPEYFHMTYKQPKGFTAPEHTEQEMVIMDRQLKMSQQLPVRKSRATTKKMARRKSAKTPPLPPSTKKSKPPLYLDPVTQLTGDESSEVLYKLNKILWGDRGSIKECRKFFVHMLEFHFEFSRGSVSVYEMLEHEVKHLSEELTAKRLDELIRSHAHTCYSRPLSQASGLQLGLFLATNFHKHSISK